MNTVKSFAICALAFLSCLRASCEDAIAPMPDEYRASADAVLAAASKIKPEDYPNADFVLLEDVVYTTYESDGTCVSWDDEWEMVLTEKGCRDLSTIELAANRRYGDVAVEFVEIYRYEEGKLRKIDIPFRDTLVWATDNESMEENIYDPQHQILSCGVPGVRKMDIRHVVTARRIFKPRMKESWSDMSLFEYTVPMVHSKYIVSAPESLPPARIATRNELDGDCVVRRLPDVKQPGRIVMSWEAANAPQAFAEPDMPPMHTQLQRLMLSTLADWPAVSRWYWNLCLPHLDAMTDEMRAKARELAASAGEGEIARIRAIYKFVAQEIRYMGITAEDDAPGYEPHDVKMTYEKRYGVCRDKAALLAAMLRAAGIEGFPVLIHAGAKLDREVPLPYFNHAITAARLADGSFVLMDPTDESSRELLPAYLSNRSYLVATPEGEDLKTSPVTPAADNALVAETTGTLLEDGSAVVTSTMTFKGINDNAYRGGLLRLTPSEKKRFFARFATRVAPGAEVLEWDVAPHDLRNTEEPLVLKFTAKMPELVLEGETRAVLRLPFVTRHIGTMNFAFDDNTSLETRRFDLFLSSTCETDETLVLNVADALGDVASLPADADIGAGTGYSFKRHVECADGVIRANRKRSLSAVEFTPAEYALLRENKKATETAERAECVFAKRQDSDADVNQIFADTQAYLVSPTAWTVTNTVVKSILSYRGKKDSAELQYMWNTAVGYTELVSAEVVSPDGKKHSISPNEINVMDASWVGAAPRYPASKIMVASLPSVEIGSTINVVEAKCVTNSPVALATTFVYDSNNPMGVKRVTVEAPEEVRLAVAGRNGVSFTNSYGRVVSNPAKLPRETAQPASLAWRDAEFVTACNWKTFLDDFTSHYNKARYTANKETAAWAKNLVKDAPSAEAKLYIIRRSVNRRIRRAGPGLFEVPFDQAFFPPDVTLKDGYASGPDKMNFLAAALEAVGFDVEVYLCADDDKTNRELVRLYIEAPRPQMFSTILLKVSHRSGVWPFGKRKSWWIGGENEYTPIETTSHVHDTILDTATGRFSVIESPEAPAKRTIVELRVRENGTVDIDFKSLLYGAGVGAFRKKYIEMLPEDRSRHFLALLGVLSDNATATRELETDVRSYPAEMSFSACAPHFAVVDNDSITVKLPDFNADLVQVGGPVRKSPIAVPGTDAETTTYRIVFPEGYTEIEHLPESWEFTPPGEKSAWRKFCVKKTILPDGCLAVEVSADVPSRSAASVFPAEYFDNFKSVNRRAASTAGRTIIVRKRN